MIIVKNQDILQTLFYIQTQPVKGRLNIIRQPVNKFPMSHLMAHVHQVGHFGSDLLCFLLRLLYGEVGGMGPIS